MPKRIIITTSLSTLVCKGLLEGAVLVLEDGDVKIQSLLACKTVSPVFILSTDVGRVVLLDKEDYQVVVTNQDYLDHFCDAEFAKTRRNKKQKVSKFD